MEKISDLNAHFSDCAALEAASFRSRVSAFKGFYRKGLFFIFLFFLPVMYDSIGKLRFTEYSVETTAQRRRTTKIKVFSSSLPTGAERWTRVG